MYKCFPVYSFEELMTLNGACACNVYVCMGEKIPLCPIRSSGDTVSSLSISERAAVEMAISKSTPASKLQNY